MKNNRFIIFIFLLAMPFVFAACTDAPSSASVSGEGKEIYEWRIYSLHEGGAAVLDSFFGDVLLPAYNRQNVSVGAFCPYREGDAELRYLLFVYPDMDSYMTAKQEIWKDRVFREAAQAFYDRTATEPAYKEFESLLCVAFDKMPKMRMPDKDRTLFELRHYRSPNEEANQRKITMFNKDEMAIFDRVGINSVCYGEVLAGIRQPSLIYLTWYRDEPVRNEVWRNFVGDPDWIRIRDMKEYAHTAVDNKNVLLSPMPYSQF
jgi:hypothetical protein